jgi:Calcineurin-like phosphoesterase
MPDPIKILATVRRAAELARATPGRSGSVVTLGESATDVLVVGDLHGHIHNFAAALKVAALATNPGRHFVVQELVHDPRTDPDGSEGDLSHRLVDVVCALKCQYPDRVHYLPGNHELSELTGRSIAKKGVPLNSLFRLGLENSYGAMAGAIREAYDVLFRSLPLAIRTPNRVFVCHTIPEARQMDTFDPSVLAADEWTPESLVRGGSVYAMTWGRDTSIEAADRFAQIVDADLFVCGHQPCDEGFKRANDRLVILDGTDPIGAYCLFPARGPIGIDDLLADVKVF